MSLIINNLPAAIDAELRKRAQAEGKPLDQFVADLLIKALGSDETTKRRDLSHIIGSWEDDPEFDRIMAEQDRIDPETWK